MGTIKPRQRASLLRSGRKRCTCSHGAQMRERGGRPDSVKKKKGLMWTGRECTAPPFVKRNGEKEPLSFSHPRPTHTDSATFFSFFLACLSALLTVREFCAAVHQRSGAAAACPPAAHLHSSRSTHISVAGRRPGSGAGTLVHPPSRQQPRKAPRRA